MVDGEKENTDSWRGQEPMGGEESLASEGEREENSLLPKPERLAKKKEIRETLKAKQYVFNGSLLYFVARENFLPKSRIAVTASKRLGSSVKRNRLRRVLSEAFSRTRNNLLKSIDIILYPKPVALTKGLGEIEAELKLGLGRLKIYRNG